MDVRKLIQQLGRQEQELLSASFLAPRVAGGAVRARIGGLIYTFRCSPREFEGWGVFQPADSKRARLVEEADPTAVTDYLALLPAFRVRLAAPLSGATWLAYPVSEGDARQRLGKVEPVTVHLVTEGLKLEQVVTRRDGSTLWFEAIDRQADPEEGGYLREALGAVTAPADLKRRGLTPEMRAAYELATQSEEAFNAFYQASRDEHRLKGALRTGGGTLDTFMDRGDHWVVEWTDGAGFNHSSAIAKGDLTVVSAGICLAGRDRDFDLQSLVGVVEGYD